VDITAYGARAIPNGGSISTTVSSVTDSTHIVLAGASSFLSGDNVAIFGGGAAITLATPGTPTVVPSVAAGPTGAGVDVNAPAGGGAFAYKIIALTKNGGYTVASASGSTATGGTLGPNTVAVTSCTRASNVMTCLTAAPHTLSIGAAIHLSGTADTSYVWWGVVATVPDNTHFTALTGISTAGDNAPASTTGGTLAWMNCNHITWAAVPNTYMYGIYGRTAGAFNLIGYSRPTGLVTELYFDDFGSPMMDSPTPMGWIPSTAPVIGQADALVTSIVAGGGTTLITLTAPMITTPAVGSFVQFTDWPQILAAATAANLAHTVVYIPPVGTSNFVIGSYATLPLATTLRQSGNLLLANTLELSFDVRWINDIDNGGVGHLTGISVSGATTYVSAWPGILGNNASSSIFDGPVLSYTGVNNALLFLCDCGVGVVWKNSSFYTGGTAADLMGTSLVFRDQGFDIQIKNSDFVGGPGNNLFNTTWTPQIMVENVIPPNGVGNIDFEHLIMYVRGIGWAAASAPMTLYIDTAHTQGPITPFIMTTSHFGQNFFNRVIIDSAPEPVIANMSGTDFASAVWMFGSYNQAAAGDSITGGNPGSVSGAPFSDLHVESISTGANVGQNYNESDCNVSNVNIPVYGARTLSNSDCKMRMPLHFPAQHTLYFDLTPVTGVGTVVSAGGAVPVATHTYAVAARGPDGGYTQASALISAVVTGGNQTVTTSWSAKQGALCYDVYRDGTLANLATCLTTLTYVDTYGFTQGGLNFPTAGGTGLSGITGTMAYAPQLCIPGLLSGNVSFLGCIVQSVYTATRNWTMFDATDTVVGRATTDTLTNKSLTSPALTTPTIGSGGTTINLYKTVTDTPGAITINTLTCTDRAVALAGSGTGAIIGIAANYALEANIILAPAQAVAGTIHYHICNFTAANITLNAAATFNLMVIQ